MFFKTKQSGESVLEVMIAIVILAAVLTSTFTLIGRAITVNTNVKNRIVALNIAREGMEGVRQIRDTNWVRFSGNKRDRWNCDSIVAGSFDDSCPDKIGVSDNYYTLDYNFTLNMFDLEGTGDSNDLDLLAQPVSADQYKLYRKDGRFTHDNTGDLTRFYRQIEVVNSNPIAYADNYNELGSAPAAPAICDGSDDTCDQARMQVVSRVQWIEDGRMYKIVLEGFLYDFFQRDKY